MCHCRRPGSPCEEAQDLQPSRVLACDDLSQDVIVPFLDAKLRAPRSRYVGILRDMAQRGLIGVASNAPASYITPCFGRKKATKGGWCGIARMRTLVSENRQPRNFF